MFLLPFVTVQALISFVSSKLNYVLFYFLWLRRRVLPKLSLFSLPELQQLEGIGEINPANQRTPPKTENKPLLPWHLCFPPNGGVINPTRLLFSTPRIFSTFGVRTDCLKVSSESGSEGETNHHQPVYCLASLLFPSIAYLKVLTWHNMLFSCREVRFSHVPYRVLYCHAWLCFQTPR